MSGRHLSILLAVAGFCCGLGWSQTVLAQVILEDVRIERPDPNSPQLRFLLERRVEVLEEQVTLLQEMVEAGQTQEDRLIGAQDRLLRARIRVAELDTTKAGNQKVQLLKQERIDALSKQIERLKQTRNKETELGVPLYDLQVSLIDAQLEAVGEDPKARVQLLSELRDLHKQRLENVEPIILPLGRYLLEDQLLKIEIELEQLNQAGRRR